MQLMIDTATDDAATIRKAIRMLQALVAESGEAPPAPTPEPKSNVVVLFSKPTDKTQAAPALSEAPPPPPPLMAPPPPPSPTTNAQPSTTLSSASPSLQTPPKLPALNVSAEPVEYDSAGVPFDARIHQKTRGKKKDESWKLQKGIAESVVQSVISELAASGKMKPLTASPSGAAPNPPPSGPAGVFGKSPLPAGAEAPKTTADIYSDAPPPPPASDALPSVTFRGLVAKCAQATKDGKLTPQEIQGICQQHGAPTLMALNSMAQLIPTVNDSLDAALLMKG